MKIYTIDALAGSGKTFAIVREGHRLATAGYKVAIIQPTVGLINATITEELLRLSPVRYRAVHSGMQDCSGRVVSVLSDHLRTTPAGGELLFITHSALLSLPYWHDRASWTVIVDEIPAVEDHEQLDITDTHGLITDLLDDEAYDESYCRLTPVDNAALQQFKRISTNVNKDVVYNVFRNLASKLVSQHWDVYALDSQYRGLVNRERDRFSLLTYSVLKPSVFKDFANVIIAGACFEDSLLYLLWSADPDVVFAPYRRVKLRYTAHTRGELIDVYFGVEGNWSKGVRDRLQDDQPILERLVLSTIEVTAGEPLAYMANKDSGEDLFAGVGTQLPNSPHGLNTFQDFRHVAILSALNPTPAHFRFLQKRGVSPDEVRTALFRQAAYQGLMRIAIRNPADDRRKTVVVPDLDTAVWVADLFAGCRVRRLPDFDGVVGSRSGRKAKHINGAARQREHNRSKKLEAIAAINIADELSEKLPPISSIDLSDVSSYNVKDFRQLIQEEPMTSHGTYFESKYSSEAMALAYHSSDDEFIAALSALARQTIPNKESALLISPATYDPDLGGSSSTKRGLANVQYVRGLWFDFDGGDLTPEEFARIFWRFRVVAWNTFRSTSEQPRWRAYIPTTHAMPPAIHKAILLRMIEWLRESGYEEEAPKAKRGRPRVDMKKHGLDLSKINAASMFYLPARAQDPTASFFKDFNDGRRMALNPYDWATRCLGYGDPDPLPEPVEPATTPSRSIPPSTASPALRAMRAALEAKIVQDPEVKRARKVEAAIAGWRENGSQAGQGRTQLWSLAQTLQAAGLDRHEGERILHAEVYSAHNPGERRAEIKGLVRDWKAYPSC